MNSFGTPFTQRRGWTSSDVPSANAWQQTGLPECESQKNRLRIGPLFQLSTTVDTSILLPDGRLLRSDRIARMEAVLLISRAGLSSKKISQQAGLIDAREVEQLIGLLNRSYDATNSAFRIERTATGFLLMTRSNLVTWLDRLHQRQSQLKLSQPSMETLTIIAYQQPITRVGVESIRGVQSSEMIRQLVDRGLVKVGGEEDSLGRPFLFVTTRAFLDMFGIGRISELPDYDKIGRKPDPQKPAAAPSDVAVTNESPEDNDDELDDELDDEEDDEEEEDDDDDDDELDEEDDEPMAEHDSSEDQQAA